jgi:predicted outer membrane protein
VTGAARAQDTAAAEAPLDKGVAEMEAGELRLRRPWCCF